MSKLPELCLDNFKYLRSVSVFNSSHQTNANRGGGLASDDESDEGEEGDYTVYECPGLATVSIITERNIRKGRILYCILCISQFLLLLCKWYFRLARWRCEILCFQKIKHRKLLRCHQLSLPIEKIERNSNIYNEQRHHNVKTKKQAQAISAP